METDADRLESIKALGGQLVRCDLGTCWAIFDEPGSISRFDDTHVNSTSPQLTLRTSDAKLLFIDKRAATVAVDDVSYIVRESQRGDAPGWSTLILDEA